MIGLEFWMWNIVKTSKENYEYKYSGLYKFLFNKKNKNSKWWITKIKAITRLNWFSSIFYLILKFNWHRKMFNINKHSFTLVYEFVIYLSVLFIDANYLRHCFESTNCFTQHYKLNDLLQSVQLQAVNKQTIRCSLNIPTVCS